MAIEYKINATLHAKEVSDVFRSSGIKRPVDDLDRIQRMIDHADVIISSWDALQERLRIIPTVVIFRI